MNPIAVVHPAADLLVADEWLALRCDPRGILLIGAGDQTSPVIAGLLPAWPAPIEIVQASTVMPDSAVRTLVLQDAGEMSLAQQTALLEWLDAAGDRRVITTTRQSLLPRVESGLFSSALYYRLNMITIDFTDTDTSVVS
jgi:hypothetical protein